MKKVRITVMKKACYADLIEKYENPIDHACDMKVGQVFVANGWQKPEGLCDSAWESMSPFVMALAHGGEDFYDGWMKNKRSAMISCNDGFRPVSFLLETLEQAEPAPTRPEADADTKSSWLGNGTLI
ncbi:MAG: TIGR04076 family protein [Huintestinicola sp.]